MVNKIAEILIEHGAIEFGEFTLASGAKSSYYIDIKTACTKPALLSQIGEAISEKFEFDVVAGVAVGAVPIAVAASLSSGRPFCIIRKEEKEYGLSGNIIGDVRGKNVLLVEDVTTSGGSVIYGINSLKDAGANIDTVVCVVDREQGAEKRLAVEGVTLKPLASVSELLSK
ncbi:orotate phosphoribosyltransferase [Methanoplanus endosymbiosus]|uniref:Orotate phosphoribosyltransferase n=1 Tax=Methanoplanus endosymbiosus TaxID=33865 RepID=A0A9E7TH68_9EURY|nr:orotate phosphoribosyltransferase [Methanoplanus endosymbiosus]UUX92337.1 orotate phosphoribosyltransferase [Methanoplanus endosymbiosus]